jgi:CRP/FNR family transcriptional regulator
MAQGLVVEVEPEVRTALADSHLRNVPPATLGRLLEGSRRVAVRAGSTVRGAGELGPHLELLVHGFVRIFTTAPDGRTLTIRYVRRGALTGVASLFSPHYSMPGSIQALRDSEIVVFDAEVVRSLAGQDHDGALALLAELSERVVSFVAEIPGSAFASVRQRVTRHLLDLASERQLDDALVAQVSQQALADAVGSVREVVVRVLRDLREEGLIRTGRSGVTILDPDRLMGAAVARPESAGRS